MKWFVFSGALLSAVVLGILLRDVPRLRSWLWILVGLLPFFLIGALDINVVSFEKYRGDSRGIEITVLDLLLLIIWIARPPTPQPAPTLFRGAYAAYLATALLSVPHAAEPLFSWFSIWKLVRMYVVLHVVATGAQDSQAIHSILRGMAVAVLCQCAVTLFQRYGLGFHQTPGLFGHQNSLGTAVCMVAPVFLGLSLAQPRSWLYASAVAAGGLALVLGLSRGALAIFLLVSGLTLFLSISRNLAPRKLAVAGFAVVLAAAVLLKASDTILNRFVNAPEASAEARVKFDIAAGEMLREHPLGIGINQYSFAMVQQGFADGENAEGRPADGGEPVYGGVAHNIYWLTAAELGFPGILAFAWLVVAPVWKALLTGWRLHDLRGDLLIGLGLGLLGLWLHGLLEWTFRQTSISYLFWIQLALISPLTGPMRSTQGAHTRPRSNRALSYRPSHRSAASRARPGAARGPGA